MKDKYDKHECIKLSINLVLNIIHTNRTLIGWKLFCFCVHNEVRLNKNKGGHYFHILVPNILCLNRSH